MNKVKEACLVGGEHRVFINSKRFISEAEVKRNVPKEVKVRVEGPRNLYNDVKEFWGAHLGILVFTGGLALFGYVGFWLYEKWKPLYIVYLDVPNKRNNKIEYFDNPFQGIKVQEY
jgi:hypothetical protein